MIKRLKEKVQERKNKKKKGFTLVELLAVIVILAIIMVITIPTVLGNMSKSKEKAFETVGQTMKKYLVDNYNNCRLGNSDIAKYDEKLFKTDGSCQLNDNISDALIINSGYSNIDIKEVIVTGSNGNYELKIIPQDGGEFSGVNDLITGELHYTQSELMGNDPDLSTGLIPVVYDDTKGSDTHWFVADVSQKWYSYTSIEQWWANAVSVDSSTTEKRAKYVNADGTYNTGIEIATSDMLAMFVWIPRYSYTIGCTSSSSCLGYKVEEASALSTSTPGAIDIKFVSVEDELEIPDMDNGIYPNYTYTSEEDRNPTNYYTHPAFNFGNDKLTGIWVGKFETSVNPSSDCYTALINKSGASSKCKFNYKNANQEEDVTPRILPNVLSLVYQNVYNEFETAKKFASNTMYGFTNKTDSHMMKNSEWAAVAYLSQSIYGKYGNANYTEKNKEIYKNDSGTTDYWSRYTGRSQGLAPATNSFSEQGTYKYDDISTTDGTKVANSGTGTSTTGNIYGIYDMVGGAYEYVMGNYGTETDGVFTGTVASSKITFSDIDIKYYDKFTTTTPSTTKSNQTIGQAYVETAGWYLDSNGTLSASFPWVHRGGSFSNSFDAGTFNSSNFNGSASSNHSFRSVLVTIE